VSGTRTAVAAGIALVIVACGGGGDLVFESTEREPTAQVEIVAAADGTNEMSAPDGVPNTPTSTGAPLPNRTARLVFTGDTLVHSPLWRQAQRNAGGSGYDFFPMFADIASTIGAADLAVCHLETPIAPGGEEFSTDPLYGVPPQIATALASAGYDRCSTASNHVLDRYARGIDRTVNVLEENGIGQSGMARNELEALPIVFDVNGIRMSHLSYTYGTNGIPLPSGEPWRTNLIDPVRIIRDAKSARDLGAEFVVVSMHWGTEKVVAPNEQQRSVADEITLSGAIDLVIGHHAHVLQPIEQVNGVWVAYGLSNIVSNLPVNDSWPASSQDAAIAEFAITVDDAGNTTIEPPIVRPTWVDKDNGWVVRDVNRMLARNDLTDWQRDLLERSRERSADVVGDFFPA
jgi:poly-gamma-glutamate capsule biosynthesis protein CapA/YwtB (metallophosphatase superfamily)